MTKMKVRKRRLPKSGRRHVVSLSIMPTLLDKLYEICDEKKVTFSVLVDEMGRQYIDDYKTQKKVEALEQQRLLAQNEELKGLIVSDYKKFGTVDWDKYSKLGYSDDQISDFIDASVEI